MHRALWWPQGGPVSYERGTPGTTQYVRDSPGTAQYAPNQVLEVVGKVGWCVIHGRYRVYVREPLRCLDFAFRPKALFEPVLRKENLH